MNLRRLVAEELLPRVQKPVRYLGTELNSARKDPSSVRLRVALAFPDVYEIGMSHLGLKILYHILNSLPDVWAERVFAPGADMEELLREKGLPLFALESRDGIGEFDILGFTLQYELSYTNVLNMMELGGIPTRRRDRAEKDPLIIGGGPCAFNPEPLAEFFDLFVVGDAEEVIVDIARAAASWRSGEMTRAAMLWMLARKPGIYVPSLYDVTYDAAGKVGGFTAAREAAPLPVKRAVVADLDAAPYPDSLVVPFGEVVHDRATVEVMRGCSRGCRFCQAGVIYRPVRERRPETVRALAGGILAESGYDEVSLSSLSTSDYTPVAEVVGEMISSCGKKGITVTLPSLRADSFAVNLANATLGPWLRKSGITFAPEAGTQRLRDVINKGVTEDNLYAAVRDAFRAGWDGIKLYFMIGLPTETDEDLEGIARLARRVLAIGREEVAGVRSVSRVSVSVSASSFVPKAHTPFQWEPQVSRDELARRQEALRRLIRGAGLTFQWHDTRTSFLEAVFARGDRRLAEALLAARRLGCRFDSWREHFRFEAWLEAFAEVGLDPEFYAYRRRDEDEILPWEIIDSGVSKEFLSRERKRAWAGKTTSDCRYDRCSACGLCDDLSVAPLLNIAPADRRHVRVIANGGGDEVLTEGRAKAGEAITVHGDAAAVLRLQLAKTGEMRFLSHLDLVRTFGRALRRSGLPVALTQGFHPQLRVSFASALGVGVTSVGEYADVVLTSPVDPADARRMLSSALPPGLAALDAALVSPGGPSLGQLVGSAVYRLVVDPEGAGSSVNEATLRQRVGELMNAARLPVRRHTKKGEVEVDLRPRLLGFRVEGFVADSASDGRLAVIGGVTAAEGHSVRPEEILALLDLEGALERGAVAMERLGLFAKNGDALMPPDHTPIPATARITEVLKEWIEGVDL